MFRSILISSLLGPFAAAAPPKPTAATVRALATYARDLGQDRPLFEEVGAYDEVLELASRVGSTIGRKSVLMIAERGEGTTTLLKRVARKIKAEQNRDTYAVNAEFLTAPVPNDAAVDDRIKHVMPAFEGSGANPIMVLDHPGGAAVGRLIPFLRGPLKRNELALILVMTPLEFARSGLATDDVLAQFTEIKRAPLGPTQVFTYLSAQVPLLELRHGVRVDRAAVKHLADVIDLAYPFDPMLTKSADVLNRWVAEAARQPARGIVPTLTRDHLDRFIARELYPNWAQADETSAETEARVTQAIERRVLGQAAAVAAFNRAMSVARSPFSGGTEIVRFTGTPAATKELRDGVLAAVTGTSVRTLLIDLDQTQDNVRFGPAPQAETHADPAALLARVNAHGAYVDHYGRRINLRQTVVVVTSSDPATTARVKGDWVKLAPPSCQLRFEF